MWILNYKDFSAPLGLLQNTLLHCNSAITNHTTSITTTQKRTFQHILPPQKDLFALFQQQRRGQPFICLRMFNLMDCGNAALRSTREEQLSADRNRNGRPWLCASGLRRINSGSIEWKRGISHTQRSSQRNFLTSLLTLPETKMLI